MKTYLLPLFILGTAFSLRLQNANSSTHPAEIKKNNTDDIDLFKQTKNDNDEQMQKTQSKEQVRKMIDDIVGKPQDVQIINQKNQIPPHDEKQKNKTVIAAKTFTPINKGIPEEPQIHKFGQEQNNFGNAKIETESKASPILTKPEIKDKDETKKDLTKSPIIHEPNTTKPLETKLPVKTQLIHPDQPLSKPTETSMITYPALKSLDESDPTKNEINCNSKGRCWKWCNKDGFPLFSLDSFHMQTNGQWCFTSVENTCTQRKDCIWHSQCVSTCQAHWGEE